MKSIISFRKQPSIRMLVAGVVLAPVVVASVALVALLFTTSRTISESLGGSVLETETARVSDEVRLYLSEAVRVSDLYARRLGMGTLPIKGLTAWEPLMADDLFTSRRVASICFGNRDGESTYLQLAHGQRELGRVPGPGEGQAVEYVVNPRGEIGRTIRTYKYDCRERPWYTTALKYQTARWTTPYFWFGTTGGETETGNGYTRVINDANGRLAGVLTIDVTLGALSDFLQALPFSATGHVYIVDDDGLLVAASHGAVNSTRGERLRLDQSSDPVAKVVAAALAGAGKPVPASAVRVELDGQPARAKVTTDRPYPGIDWRIITVLPEREFLADAGLAQRRAVTMACLATAGALALGLFLGRRITSPLRKLTDHVTHIGEGHLDRRLELRAARELSQVAGAINEMAGGLRQRMELEQSLALATQVQQSLLPQGVDPPPGLDLAGVSRYCDQTGGDYFDFVDIAGLPEGRMLIAVGDVTGHGIAAALLMATARAALRTGALHHDSLADMLAKVNHILAKDARHERYMTMVLLTIDPAAHSVRWASAGHDPVLVYHPSRGEFTELGDSDLLLGAVDDVPYAEHRFDGLNRGSVLLVGTDGIWESVNLAGEMYGKDRLRAFLKGNAHKSAIEIVRALEVELDAYRQGKPRCDDVTFVVAKMVGVPPVTARAANA